MSAPEHVEREDLGTLRTSSNMRGRGRENSLSHRSGYHSSDSSINVSIFTHRNSNHGDYECKSRNMLTGLEVTQPNLNLTKSLSTIRNSSRLQKLGVSQEDHSFRPLVRPNAEMRNRRRISDNVAMYISKYFSLRKNGDCRIFERL